MADPNTRVITRIKLDELQRQRDRLTAHYAAVEQQARAAGTPLDRLRVLYNGLRQARFAQKPLHPDVDNLDLVFFEAASGTASAELVQQWVRQLERELARCRLRTEFAHAFGQTLSEWANAPTTATTAEPGAEEPWAVLGEEAPAVDLGMLHGIFERNAAHFTPVRAGVQSFGEGEALAPVKNEEVKALLALLAGDIYRQSSIRRQAAAVRGSDTLVNEYAGVLTVLVNNLGSWNWPADGVEGRGLWARGKWRPYLDEDFVTLLFLELIGLRWGMRLKSLAQENLLSSTAAFLVSGQGLEDMIKRMRNGRAASLFLTQIPNNLRLLAGSEGYGGRGGYGRARGAAPEKPTALEQLLTTVMAEIRFQRTLTPDRPLHVVQADLRDFYLRIPHPVLLALAERLGFPPAWQEFLRKYLQVPLRFRGERRVVRRGVVLGHLFGAVLADWLLLLLDLAVYQATGVRQFRVVDDVYVVTPDAGHALQSWQLLRQFCAGCGLEVNEAKSGAVTLGGAAPAGLPAGPPHWGFLRLQADGTWTLDEPALDRFQEQTRRLVAGAPTVLGMVAQYNDQVAFLQRSLGLCVRLDDEHLNRVGRRLARLHQGLFGAGHGLAEEVRRRLRQLFLDARLQEAGLPEALLYWPITAGGLGLVHPLIAVRGFQQGLAAIPSPPAGRGSSILFQWQTYYRQLLATNSFAGPTATPRLETLVSDFIARGGEVGGRKQAGLSPYWRWVVYTYGPVLLEDLGTFRFLLTELVPLQLILENRIEATTLGGGEGSANFSSAGGDIPF